MSKMSVTWEYQRQYGDCKQSQAVITKEENGWFTVEIARSQLRLTSSEALDLHKYLSVILNKPVSQTDAGREK